MPETNSQSEEQIRESIVQLTSVAFNPTVLNIGSETASESLLAFSWFIRVLRTAKAIVVLYDNHLGVESAPLERSLIEHVAHMSLLRKQPNEVLELIVAAHRGYQRKLIDRLRLEDWHKIELDDEFERFLESKDGECLGDETKKLNTTEKRFKLSDLDHYLGVWKILSSMSHATYLSGMAYVAEQELINGRLSYSGEPRITPAGLLPVLGMVLRAFEELRYWAPIQNPEIEGILARSRSIHQSNIK